MALTLILALILAPVAAADNCVSSASWTKRDEPRKDCAWVGRLPEKRCDVRGAAPAGSAAAYVLARDACPAECDPSCAPEWGGRPRAPPGPFTTSLEDGCFANPAVCLLNETCVRCAAGDTKGCCRVPKPLWVPGVRLGLVDDARGRARARRRLPQPVVHDLRQRREALEARRRVGRAHPPSPSPSLHHKHYITRSPTASAARAASLYLPHRPHHRTSRRPMRIDSLPLF